MSRRRRKGLASVSLPIFVGVGLAVPLTVFATGVMWLLQGLPLLELIWHVRPAARPRIILAIAVLAAAIAIGLWVGREVGCRIARLVHGPHAWVFALRSMRPTGFGTGGTRLDEGAGLWFRIYSQFGSLLWPLLGAATAAAVILPVAIWWVAGGNAARAEWLTLAGRRDRVVVTVLVASLLASICTGLPAAVVGWLQFAKHRLVLSDEEIRSFFPETSRQRAR